MLSVSVPGHGGRRFAVQLLGSLRFMAQQHVVHCDLKPENILLVEPNKARIKACTRLSGTTLRYSREVMGCDML